MQIRELRLAGFKSFVDPMRLAVEPGLTGIVGPNGCGKSNLLEAMRWVMGAASAKALRGEDMDDVIFAGSGARPAREHAEVAITLSNEDGRAPEPFRDVDSLEIIRRIRRQAGSTYKINGKEVRARDVQLLFADAATGANSPSLVRQGQVSELINAKPENRRRILEDAAGIAGLQSRRHEAELKLKGAEANLQRVDEIAREIGAGLADLRKQAEKARRYRALQAEIRALEALLAALKWRERLNVLESARSFARQAEEKSRAAQIEYETAEQDLAQRALSLKPLEEESLIAGVAVSRYAGEAETIIRAQTEALAAFARAEAELTRLAADSEREQALEDDARIALTRLESDRQTLAAETGPEDSALSAAGAAADAADRAREAAEAALEANAARIASARAQAAASAREAEAAERRAQEAREARARAATAEAGLATGPAEAALAAARAALAQAEQAQAVAETAAEAAESELRAADLSEQSARQAASIAETQLRGLEAELSGLRKALAAPGAGPKFPAVLESITTEPGFERALAAALGDDLEAALDPAAALFWGGRAGDTRSEGPPPGAVVLADKVRAPAALAARLAACWVVDKAEGAGLQNGLARGQRLVSREGDLWRWDGFVRKAEAPSPQAARLAQRARIEALEASITPAQAALTAAQSAHQSARERRQSMEAKAREARKAAPGAIANVARVRTEESRCLRELDHLRVRAQSLAAERERLSLAETEAEAGLERAKAALAAAPDAGGEEELAAIRAEAEARRRAAAAARAEIARLSGERLRVEERRSRVMREFEAWTNRLNSAAARLTQLTRQQIEAENLRDSVRAKPAELAREREKLAESMALAERRKAKAVDGLREAEASLKSAERRKREAERGAGDAREARAAGLARLEAAAERLEGLAGEIRSAFGASPDQVAEEAAAFFGAKGRDWDIPRAEERAERLRREREAMGGVNLAADEAVSAQETRLSELDRERTDIEGAIAKLRQSGLALDSEGRARLVEAFDTVNAHFQSLFTSLFEGGQAELKLTQSEDALASGLEIYACPPGKRLASMSLMSGGEQALTATALIFAIFLSNPSPICVLDEVDAPLDDANVERFCRLLDEMRRRTNTRFLVITHNPVTMARMDRLFGVTMAEQGVSTLVSVDLRQAEQLTHAA